MSYKVSTFAAFMVLLSGSLLPASFAEAEDTLTVKVILKNHQFSPAEIHIPAGKSAVLEIENADPTAEEFDSPALEVEKVIAPGQTGTIHLRPLAAGRYSFKGEFHEDTATGTVVAE